MSMSKSKRVLKPLPSNLRSMVRSGIAITSVSQCVEELVYNAIDAEAKTILIGVNIDQFNVRTEDDGQGINESDIEAVGVRYATSKCNCLDDLTRLKFYGFRGEALASIVNVSSTVDIITRPKDTPGIELKKKFEDGRAAGFVEKYNAKNNKPGTVIVVGRLLSKLPVRQNRIDKSIQLEEVKNCLERIALINPSLSIELRNEKLGTQLFDFKTSNSYSEAFDKLFKNRLGFEVNFMEEHFRYKTLFFHFSISKKFFRTKNHQFVYVNNRFIQRNRIYKWIGRSILEEQRHDLSSPKGDKYPIFILNITCPLKEYDVTLEPKKQLIEFKVWEDVQNGIEGLVSKLKMTNSFGISATKNTTLEVKNASFISNYNVKGTLHSRFAARPDDKSESRSKETNSDRGSLGRSSSGGLSTSRRSLTRTWHNSHVVDVRAVRRKRKLENLSLSKKEPSAMLYSIGNKPLLTEKIFCRFTDWKEEIKKPDDKSHSKRFKNRQEEDEPKAVDRNASTSSAAVLMNDSGDRNYNSAISPSSKSVYQWKINRWMQDCQPANVNTISAIGVATGDELRVSSTTVNSLDGLDSASTCHNTKPCSTATMWQRKILSKTDEYLKELVEEQWKLPNTKKAVLDTIIQFWKVATQKDPKKIPKSSKLMKEQQHHKSTTKERKSLETSFSFLHNSDKEPKNLSAHVGNKIIEHQNLQPKIKLNESVSSVDQLIQDSKFKIPFSVDRSAPPLLNLFPYQKSGSTDWNDKMLSEDFESDSDLFDIDWSVEIVLDQHEQEWLQTEDEKGRKMYINLTTGSSSYDMVNIFDRVKVTGEEMKKCNPTRYKWLRKHFPRGFQQFLNTGEREIRRQGDLTKIDHSIIKDSLLQGLQDQKPLHSKWNENEFKSASKYFNESNSATFQAVSINNNSKFSNIQCWKTLSTGTSSFRFAREDFECTKVIGQLDKKFILAGIRKSQTENMTLVVFDQHAVHERIRLEKFISESYEKPKAGKKYLKMAEVMPPYPINLSDSEVRLMKNHEDIFCQAGVKFQRMTSVCVKIRTVPKCFFEKSATEVAASREAVFRNLICNLIKELVRHIMGTKGANLVVLPKTVHELLCSQACHGAIKFGDALDTDMCTQLIADLKKCKSLFQCAHGRPTVVPLIKAEDLLRTCTAIPANPPAETTEEHLPFPASFHAECSSYFCKYLDTDNLNETSEYFSGTNFSNPNFITKEGKMQDSAVPFVTKAKIDVTKPQPTNLFHLSTDQPNSEDQDDGEDDTESPYFFK